MIKYITLFILFLASSSFGAVIFQDDFDDHSDWTSPNQEYNTGSDRSYADGDDDEACSVCPDGAAKYAGLYNARSAWSDYRGNNTLSISSTNARSGKALTVWMEPSASTSCDGGTGWCSDGQLAIVLPTTYNELYVRFYIKFQATWVWDVDTSAGAAEKFVRVSNYHTPSPGNMFSYGPNVYGSHHPVAYWDIGWYPVGDGSTTPILNIYSPRYQATFYANIATPQWSGNGGSVDNISVNDGTCSTDKCWDEYLGDGDWHCVEMQVKGNTAGGYYSGSANGEWKMWIDEELIYSRADMAWGDGDDTDNYWAEAEFPGWNYVSIGGNGFNRVYAADDHTEQWYAIDDFVISTTYVGLNEVAGEPPYVDGYDPAMSAVGVSRTSNIHFHVKDASEGVDASSIVLSVEGVDVTGSASIGEDGNDVEVTYNPSDFSSGQVVNVTIDADDLDDPPNSMTTVEYYFTVENFGTSNVAASSSSTDKGISNKGTDKGQILK